MAPARHLAPLAAAIRWERRHLPAETAPLTKLDAEAAFLLAIPLLKLRSDLSGQCRLAIELRNGDGGHRIAGVLVGVREGSIVSCSTRLEGEAAAWAAGSVTGWLSAVVDGDTGMLEVGGDCKLAVALLESLHGALLAVRESV